jgi:hypothetical protein
MVFFVMESFQMNASQDSQAGLGVIRINRNRALVVSVLHHLAPRCASLLRHETQRQVIVTASNSSLC